MRLNLGCWGDYREGWVNVEHPDNAKLVKADVYQDLNSIPYAFGDSSADEIYMSHVLEHLDDPITVMNECWRVLKPEGRLTVKVPHFTDANTYRDLTHKRGFAFGFMNYFAGNGGFDYYSKRHWRIVSGRMSWKKVMGRKLDWLTGTVLSPIVDTLINASPYGAETFFVYLIGGIAEIQYVMEPLKAKPGEKAVPAAGGEKK